MDCGDGASIAWVKALLTYLDVSNHLKCTAATTQFTGSHALSFPEMDGALREPHAAPHEKVLAETADITSGSIGEYAIPVFIEDSLALLLPVWANELLAIVSRRWSCASSIVVEMDTCSVSVAINFSTRT